MSVEVKKFETDKFHQDTEVERFKVRANRVKLIPTEPEPKSRKHYDSIAIVALSSMTGGRIYRVQRRLLPDPDSAITIRDVERQGQLIDHVITGEHPNLGPAERIYDKNGQVAYTLLFSSPRPGGQSVEENT